MIQSQSIFRAVVIALVVSTGLSGASALASESKKKNHEVARQALLRKEVLPLTQILAIAARRAPGEVIEVELEDAGGGRLKYDLKILAKNGRVRELELDAKTGATLKLEDD